MQETSGIQNLEKYLEAFCCRQFFVESPQVQLSSKCFFFIKFLFLGQFCNSKCKPLIPTLEWGFAFVFSLCLWCSSVYRSKSDPMLALYYQLPSAQQLPAVTVRGASPHPSCGLLSARCHASFCLAAFSLLLDLFTPALTGSSYYASASGPRRAQCLQGDLVGTRTGRQDVSLFFSFSDMPEVITFQRYSENHGQNIRQR